MQNWSQTEIDKALQLLEKDVNNIKWMKRPPRVVQLAAVIQSAHTIKYIRYPDVDIQLMAVEKNPRAALSWIRNPSPEAYVKACELYGENLAKIKNPTSKMIRAAVKNCGDIIRIVSEQTEELHLLALASNPRSFCYFKHPSRYVRKRGLELMPDNIRFVSNPSVAEQMSAMTRDPGVIGYIKNPCPDAQVLAVRDSPTYYSKIKAPSEAASIEYVKHGPQYISNVKNPSKATKWAAIMANPDAINFIENPSEAMKATAIICG